MDEIPKSDLASSPAPHWLLDLNPRAIRDEEFPQRDVLKNSLYYPSSGLDAKPIKHLGGAVHSFVHADYGISRDKFLAELDSPGLRGYQILGSLDVTETLGVRDWMNPGRSRLLNWVQEPFAHWSIWERTWRYAKGHGPKRLSLLHLCVEGVTAYWHLYRYHLIAPTYLAFIQPGVGLGGNWTDYTKPGRPMHQAVMHRSENKPAFLVHGGMCGAHTTREHYQNFQCWPEYPRPLNFFPGRNSSFRVWGRPSTQQSPMAVNKLSVTETKKSRRSPI